MSRKPSYQGALLMTILKRIVNGFLCLLGLKTKDSAAVSDVPQDDNIVPTVISSARAVFMRHDNSFALVVNHEFDDVPSWVECDIHRKKISIAQMGGNVTEITVGWDGEAIASYQDEKRVYLIARYEGRSIIQNLTFIARH